MYVKNPIKSCFLLKRKPKYNVLKIVKAEYIYYIYAIDKDNSTCISLRTTNKLN